MHVVTLTVIAIAAGVASLAGCRDQGTTPPPGARPIPSVTGIPSTETQMRARLERATRLVALALADPPARAYVYEQLHASPYREHKLHFGPFLEQPGNPLSAQIAAEGGLTEVGLQALLDSLIDLEFYMPVKDHYALDWRP